MTPTPNPQFNADAAKTVAGSLELLGTRSLLCHLAGQGLSGKRGVVWADRGAHFLQNGQN